MKDYKLDASSVTIIWVDNKSSIAIAKNPQHHGRTKHIDIKFYFIYSMIGKRTIVVKHCSTEEQQAIILTKALGVKQHVVLRSLIGVCNLQLRGNLLVMTEYCDKLVCCHGIWSQSLDHVVYLHQHGHIRLAIMFWTN